MGNQKTKLELAWIGKENRPKLEPRVLKVIDGEDPGGVTAPTGWEGGGFRAPSLLEKDKWGNWVINKQYNAAMLSEALCKRLRPPRRCSLELPAE